MKMIGGTFNHRKGVFHCPKAEDQRVELHVNFHRVERKMVRTKMETNAKGAKRSAKS